MAGPNAHLSKAVHNIKTIAFLFTGTNKKDWIATVAFYAALHIVDAVLYHNNRGLQRHGQTHNYRERLVKYNPKFQHMWTFYWSLHNESVVARYLQLERTPIDTHIDFDVRMPDDKLGPFLKAKLGGLIQSTEGLLPRDKKQVLQDAYQNELKDHLGLEDVDAGELAKQ